MICLKNCTFVVSTTTTSSFRSNWWRLWFAWKIVPLWYQQQLKMVVVNNKAGCDLLEKLYLCGINNNYCKNLILLAPVVICLKNCTFVVSTTTFFKYLRFLLLLWFAWKIVPLWYQQQPIFFERASSSSCDLLEKLYLCGINNNNEIVTVTLNRLWFAWKIVPLWYQQQL